MVEAKKAREEAKQAEMRSTAQADLEATKKAREDKKAKRMVVNRHASRAATRQAARALLVTPLRAARIL